MGEAWAAAGRVLFGRMYEDHGVELAAFPPGARVLAIASAGDTAAALARAGHDVTAVDVNPVQLRYARGRLAGAPAVAGTAERVLAAGRRVAAALSPGWRPAALRRFLELDDPAAQAAWWRAELDRPAWRGLLALALHPAGPLAALLPADPRTLLRRDRLDAVLRRRLAAGLARYPNATNPWAWRLLLGRDRPGPPDPPPVPPVRWVRADVVDHLHDVPEGWYGAATLSNVLDGAPPGTPARLAGALRHGVRGPVVLRSLTPHPPLPGRPLPDRSLLWGHAILVQGDP
jgi:hypothetical protein